MINPGTLPCPWYIYIGATFNPILTWTDSAGAPIDLTGYDAIMEIRPYAASATIIATLSIENGGIIISAPLTGEIQLLLTPEQTAALIPQETVFDLQITSAGAAEIDYLLQGQIFIKQMVTR